MNTAVPSGVTLTSVESMEIQTSGNLGIVADGSTAQAQVNTYTMPNITANVQQSNQYVFTIGTASGTQGFTYNGGAASFTTNHTTPATTATNFAAAVNVAAGKTIAYVGAADATLDITTGSATVTVDSTTNYQVGMSVTGTGIPAGAYITAITNATTMTISANATATTSNVGDGVIGGGAAGVTVLAPTAGTATPTIAFTTAITSDVPAPTASLIVAKVDGNQGEIVNFTYGSVSGSYTIGATREATEDNFVAAFNAVAGSTATAANTNGSTNAVTVTAATAGTALPTISFSGASGNLPSGTITTPNGTNTLVTATAYDVSGFTDTTDVAITASNGMGLKAAATQNVMVSGGTGSITVQGGKDVTVTDATAGKSITVGNGAAGGDAAGKITITDTNNTGTAAITTEGGTDVTITTTANKASSGNIVVGHATNGQASGAVVVTQNSTSDGTAMTAGNVTVTGGSTVNITANMTNTAAKGSAAGDITAGTFTVTAGNTTTDVTVTQVATATDFANDASLGTKETSVVTFGALKAGEKVAISAGTLTTNSFANPTTSTDLVFTASKDLTAAEVAAAFASLTNADIQAAGGKVANGIFTGTLDAGWTSGAANGAAVTFTATAVGYATNEITVTTRNKDDDGVALDNAKFGAVATNGTAAATSTAVDVSADFGAVVINDNATASIKTVTLDGYDTATIGTTTALTALTTVSLSNSSGANVIANGTATALTLNLNKITGTTNIDSGTASVTDLTVNTSGAASSTELTAAKLKNLTVSGSQLLTLTGSTLTKLDKVVVSGTAGLTIGGTNEVDTVTSVNTSATTGTTTIAIDGTKATYVGGAGVDVVTLATGTALTKSIDLGAGDDTLVFSADVTGSSTTLSGGDGTDTLSMSVARAEALDASAVSFYTNFERLTLNTAAGDAGADNTAEDVTVDLANLGLTNYVTTSGSDEDTLILDKMANNATLVITANGLMKAQIKDAATGTADVLNIIAQTNDGSTSTSDTNLGTVTAANVETINLTMNDANLNDDGDTTASESGEVDKGSLIVTADKATTLNVTGNAGVGVDLDVTGSTKLTLIDGSTMTGALTATTAVSTSAATIKGGSGDDTLTADTNGDVLMGGAGKDTLSVADNANLVQLHGGAGKDTYQIGTTFNVASFATINGTAAELSGDVIKFVDDGLTAITGFNNEKLVLDAGVASYESYMFAATSQTTGGTVSYFQWAGNTYLVQDNDNAANGTFVSGTDIVVKIAGLVDFTFNDTTKVLEIA